MNSAGIEEEAIKEEWHCTRHENIKECIDDCKVHYFLNLFGKKYTMPIIRILLKHETMRFNEIQKFLKGSPKTIASRLRNLEKHGLIKRKVFSEIPIRVEYSLTKRGKSLDDVFERFSQWVLDLNNK